MALKLVKGISKPREEIKQKSREEYLLACLREEKNDPRFSEWEKQFIASVAKQVDGGRKLTEKQQAILERIWDK
jgi:hypothetical protein